MINNALLLLSIVFLFTFLEEQLFQKYGKKTSFSFLLRTKLHFLLLGIITRFIYYDTRLLPIFHGILFLIVSFFGFLFGSQFSRNNLKKLKEPNELKIIIKLFVFIMFIFTLGYIILKNLKLAILITTIFATFSSYLIRKNSKINLYITNIGMVYAFLFAYENLKVSLTQIGIKILVLVVTYIIISEILLNAEKLDIFTIITGILLLFAGISQSLKISNIVFSFFVGILFSQAQVKNKQKIENIMLKMEYPLYAVFLFFIGYISQFGNLILIEEFIVIWLISALIKFLIFGRELSMLLISQVSLLFIVDFYKKISFDAFGGIILLYIFSNLLILWRKSEK